jgi:hypothetical protein
MTSAHPVTTIEDYLSQTEFWVASDGVIPIDTMSDEHRERAARWLVKNSGHIFQLVTVWRVLAIDLDPKPRPFADVVEQIRMVDTRPSQWIKTTGLFRALIGGLPVSSRVSV